MKLPAIGRQVAALILLLASNAASAAVLTLPAPAAQEHPLADNNNVRPLDLQSPCGSDPRCQAQSGLPAASAPGQRADPAIAPAPSIDAGQFSSSFAATSTGDGTFQTLSGNPLKALPSLPAADNAVSEELADNSAFTWKFSQGLMRTVTNVRALTALPEDMQGAASYADLAVSDRCRDAGMAGIHPECAVGSFEPVMRSLCVASDGSYNTIGASAQRDCPPGSIYVSNKRGASTMEYAAYAQSLSNFVKDAANFHRLQPVEARFPRQDGPSRQAWRCNDCNTSQGGEPEPGLLRRVMGWLKEPVVIVLLGLAMVAILVTDAVVRARRA